MSEKAVVASVIFVFFVIIVFALYLIMKHNDTTKVDTIFYPNRRWKHHHGRNPYYGSGCRCMRQDGGDRGFCGICGKDGTTYGCPYDGNNGCNVDCSKLKYTNKKACDTCRDPNCDLDQVPVYEGFGCDSLSSAKY